MFVFFKFQISETLRFGERDTHRRGREDGRRGGGEARGGRARE